MMSTVGRRTPLVGFWTKLRTSRRPTPAERPPGPSSPRGTWDTQNRCRRWRTSPVATQISWAKSAAPSPNAACCSASAPRSMAGKSPPTPVPADPGHGRRVRSQYRPPTHPRRQGHRTPPEETARQTTSHHPPARPRSDCPAWFVTDGILIVINKNAYIVTGLGKD